MSATRIVLFLFVISIFPGCQPKKFTCSNVRNGIFYFEGKLTKGKYLIIRQDSVQKEVNYSTKDTSYWKVEWFDECNYSLKYMSGLNQFTEQEQELMGKQNVYVRILNVSKDFYRVKINGGVLSSGGTIDTIWINKNRNNP